MRALGLLALAWMLGCKATDPETPAAPILEPGAELVPAGEADEIVRIERMLLEYVEGKFDDSAFAHRDAHVKAHGCVTATVTVNASLPEELAVGLFAAPQSYPAWIRFSNSADRIVSDHRPDGRGMAIKLMNVPGQKALPGHEDETSHDIVLINYPVFVVENAHDYLTFAQDSTTQHPLRFFFYEGKSYHRELKSAEKLALQDVVSPVQPTYYSMTPYLFGEGMAIKYGARPCESDHRKKRGRGDDYLRDQLTEDLETDGACYELLVQRQTDPALMPVEDPTVPWPTSVSPYTPVATIEIPAQVFDTDAQNQMCEYLSFNPWHARVDHRPLGGINRVRKAAYVAISTLRHSLDGVQVREPVDHDVEAYLASIRRE